MINPFTSIAKVIKQDYTVGLVCVSQGIYLRLRPHLIKRESWANANASHLKENISNTCQNVLKTLTTVPPGAEQNIIPGMHDVLLLSVDA